jgi:hypothetical protein
MQTHEPASSSSGGGGGGGGGGSSSSSSKQSKLSIDYAGTIGPAANS